MEDAIREFVRTVADSDVKKDLLVYFHENPAIDNCRGLAMWVNHSLEEIEAEIEDLVAAGVLTKSGEGRESVYAYQPDDAMRRRVAEFVAFYRQQREAVRDEIAELRKSLAQVREASLREILREQSKTKTILSSMADPVLVVDRDGEVVLYNPAAAQLFNWYDGKALGVPLSRAIEHSELKVLAERVALLLDSSYTMLTDEVTVSQPQTRTFKANLSPVQQEGESQPLGVVAVLRDITELKELDAMKSEFVSMVSHELRSPLTSIKGFLVSLQRGVFGPIAAKQAEALRIINDQSNRLLALINDLLEVSRQESGRRSFQFERVSLSRLLKQALELIRGQALEKKIEVKLDTPPELPYIEADQHNLELVFNNLLSNAVKYTLEGGTVTVRVEPSGEQIQFSVSDTGIGIPQDSLPMIFDKFYRVKDPRTREVTGTGLGLAIVKNIVEGHLGTIEVNSEEGKGSAFTVTLPYRQASRQQSPDFRAVQESAHGENSG